VLLAGAAGSAADEGYAGWALTELQVRQRPWPAGSVRCGRAVLASRCCRGAVEML
jgi:hypothetical protein